ncbi:agouti-related protein-like [Anoplopoma fimbria]|uniref:agouti-related protein-like n=1 Tax=Anoplopoma fimbria TaxID=229290 RepID=UPI0023EC5A00|nr:agouti-related protein-like [Anoplopoma fimbria]
MKLAVMWLCILHLTVVSAGLYNRNDPRAGHSNVPGSRAKAPQKTQPPSTGSLIQGRQGPLFARRGQYERQRIHASKPKVVPALPNSAPPPSKAAPNPVKPECSQLTQSCLPQFGCCDQGATCHCRFFNAICFCRRITS